MDFSKIASRLRGKVVRFSGELCGRLGKTASRFVVEAVYGILTSQSVMLTKIGRTLEEDVPLKKIEERFCRQLGKEGLWEKLHHSLLKQAAPKIGEDTLLILDLSDIRKKYARRMEYVTTIRDGSENTLGNGYWTCQVIGAERDRNEIVPLYQSLYSQDAPDFVSENEEILKAISLVNNYTAGRGIWVMDRGGDRDRLFTPLLKAEAKKRFIVRLVGTRHLLYRRKAFSAQELARGCECPYRETIVKGEKGAEKVYHIAYGFVPVRLPDHKKIPLHLVVVKGFGEIPMMLLTTEPLRRNKQVLKDIVSSYVRRWGIEETIRFVKQVYDLENIRVLRYVCLKNMMALMLVVFYFLAVVLDANLKLKLLAGHVLECAKRVFGIPDFKYYAIGDGICAIFRRNPGKIVPKPKKPAFWQVALKFT